MGTGPLGSARRGLYALSFHSNRDASRLINDDIRANWGSIRSALAEGRSASRTFNAGRRV